MRTAFNPFGTSFDLIHEFIRIASMTRCPTHSFGLSFSCCLVTISGVLSRPVVRKNMDHADDCRPRLVVHHNSRIDDRTFVGTFNAV